MHTHAQMHKCTNARKQTVETVNVAHKDGVWWEDTPWPALLAVARSTGGLGRSLGIGRCGGLTRGAGSAHVRAHLDGAGARGQGLAVKLQGSSSLVRRLKGHKRSAAAAADEANNAAKVGEHALQLLICTTATTAEQTSRWK